MIELIIYDFDMTLVDSRLIARKILKDVGSELGHDLLSISEEEFWGGTFKDVITLIHKRSEERYDTEEIQKKVVESAIRRYREQPLNNVETLLYLQSMKVQQAIVSQNIPPIMEACLRNPYNQKVIFKPVYSCHQSTKPARIEQITKESGVHNNNILYVGDRPDDVEAGRLAGVRTVAIPTGLHSETELKKSNPDYLIITLNELRNII